MFGLMTKRRHDRIVSGLLIQNNTHIACARGREATLKRVVEERDAALAKLAAHEEREARRMAGRQKATEAAAKMRREKRLKSMLPDGLTEKDGALLYDCGSCGQSSEWHGDAADFVLGDAHNVCGRTPSCCP